MFKKGDIIKRKAEFVNDEGFEGYGDENDTFRVLHVHSTVSGESVTVESMYGMFPSFQADKMELVKN